MITHHVSSNNLHWGYNGEKKEKIRTGPTLMEGKRMPNWRNQEYKYAPVISVRQTTQWFCYWFSQPPLSPTTSNNFSPVESDTFFIALWKLTPILSAPHPDGLLLPRAKYYLIHFQHSAYFGSFVMFVHVIGFFSYIIGNLRTKYCFFTL